MNDKVVFIALSEGNAIAALVIGGLVGLCWAVATICQLVCTLRLENWFTQRFEVEVAADKRLKEAIIDKMLKEEKNSEAA